jgi:Holliday junction resolvase RusA-like endonuclease
MTKMKKNTIYKFTIPLSFNVPPHQNNIIHTFKKRKDGTTYKVTFKTEKLRHFQNYLKAMALSLMNKRKWDMVEKEFALHIKFFCIYRKKRGDGVNMYKTVEDAFEGSLYKNDKNNIDGRFVLDCDKHNPRIEVAIKPL